MSIFDRIFSGVDTLFKLKSGAISREWDALLAQKIEAAKMTQKETGEPAFPGRRVEYQSVNGGVLAKVVEIPYEGMTLRDYFAAQALVTTAGRFIDKPNAAAAFSYKIADAMLAERSK